MTALLALDTSTEAASVALGFTAPSGAWQVIERFEIGGPGQGERVLVQMREVLAEASRTLSDVNAIAFGRGPGSFTGVRLATSVAQGLAYGASLPVVPVSTLRAVAWEALEAAQSEAAARRMSSDARVRPTRPGALRIARGRSRALRDPNPS